MHSTKLNFILTELQQTGRINKEERVTLLCIMEVGLRQEPWWKDSIKDLLTDVSVESWRWISQKQPAPKCSLLSKFWTKVYRHKTNIAH